MRGFSLPELIVVIAIVGIVGSVVVTSYASLRASGDSTRSAFIYADALREAQLRSLGMEYDTAWGVAIVGESAVVFSGTSYAARTASRDRVYALPKATASGSTGTVFAKFTGLPPAAATTTFSTTLHSAQVVVDASGTISYTP